MANRFKIVFETTDYIQDHGFKKYGYTVATELDEHKAIVYAAWLHFSQGLAQIYRVVSVERLEGTEPAKTDIVDRLEY